MDVDAEQKVWSPEQADALAEFNVGANIFLTGPGGSGKTELIKEMVRQGLQKNLTVQVCALTGCAALLLKCGAKTLHSWAGIGLATQPLNEIEFKVMNNRNTVKKWQKTDVLIIDEVSMLSQKLFELLDDLGRRTRKQYDLPFGGLQLVLSGDFYQLPPVNKSNSEDPLSGNFCFESPQWAATMTKVIQLKKIFRQADPEYASILNDLRVGRLKRKGLNILKEQIGKPVPDLFRPTKLFSRRREVDILNLKEYQALVGAEFIFELNRPNVDSLPLPLGPSDILIDKKITEGQRAFEYDYLEKSLLVEKRLRLKVGTQVMCVVNLDDTIVNGSQGIIEGFIGGLPMVQFRNGEKRIMSYNVWQSETYKSVALAQIPLIYAWGITIHKSQGCSLDVAEIDVGDGIFECGQTYVALSRVKSLAGLYLTAFNLEKIKVNGKVHAFYQALAAGDSSTMTK